MQDETSIKRQLHRETSFQPTYCPNPICQHHRGGEDFWQKNGMKKLKRFPYFSQRFRCRDCSKSFPYSFFFLEYRSKIWGLNEAIFKDHRKGTSVRETAREVGHSECMVRGRRTKMSRWGLLVHAKFCEGLKVEEPIAFDGLENFSFSQYDPNNINQAMGKNSFFVYDFNFSPINRKGRMMPAQILRKKQIEGKFGRYPADSLRISTRRVISRLFEKTKGELTLYSDEHFQYKRAVEIDLKGKNIVHLKTSSKIARNYQNPLHPVNYLDLQIRQENAAFRRETIAFSKHSVAMLESYLLYVLYRNYMRPKFFKKKKADPLNGRTPAHRLGLTKKIFQFQDLYGQRVLRTQVELNEDWENLYHRRDPLSRREIRFAA